VGRTRTLPAPPAGRLRIGYVCCARYSVAPLGVYRALAEREVDLVIHLGDYIYEDDEKRGPRRHRPPRPAVTLGDYRERLAQVREDADCQALHRRHPMTAIWDDHDFADNAWSGGAKHHDDAEHGPWAARVEAAARARQEWLPVRLADPDDPLNTWRSVPVGDLAEIVLLDTRIVGRDLQPGDEGATPRDDPDRSLLGENQRTWLHQRLADPSRPWAIVHSGVVVSELSLRLPPVAAIASLLPNGYEVVDGQIIHDDQWDGYLTERAQVLRRIRDRGSAGGATVIVSGDVHSSWAFEGPTDPDVEGDAPAVAVEMTVPSSTSVPMARSHAPGLWRVVDRAAARLPHVRWVDLTERGYSILEVTPDRAVAEWWFVDAFGGDPSRTANLGAAFVTDRTDRPPRWSPASPTPDPVRPGLPEPLPHRPDDLGRLRRRRRGRRALEILVVTGGLAAAPATALLARRRTR
jgi:alkaline phosphatase D